MPDWKEMYLHLAWETERAVRILTEAQQTCGELYLRVDEPDLRLIISNRPGQEDHDAPSPCVPKKSRFFRIFFPKTVDKPKFH